MELENVKSAQSITNNVLKTMRYVFTTNTQLNWTVTALGIQKKVNFHFNKDYVAQYYLNTDEFTGSLFTVNGASSIYKCGDYSLAGLANRGEIISRIFTTLKPHQAISFTFNFLIIDQVAPQKNTFEIYLDNVRV